VSRDRPEPSRPSPPWWVLEPGGAGASERGAGPAPAGAPDSRGAPAPAGPPDSRGAPAPAGAPEPAAGTAPTSPAAASGTPHPTGKSSGTPGPTRRSSATPDPTRRLPAEARGYFVLGSLAVTLPFVIAAFVVAGALPGDPPDALVWALRATVVAVLVIGGIALPLLRWRSWRYEVRDEELDLLRGAVVVRRTLIPMTRIQHVDTTRNVVGDLFGLRSVVVHTAAGSNDIPALRPADADAIRDRIAQLARRPDEL
jgi:membrane protein YdbS with pleckstrin-like domain